jgi:hypothetical protein
VVDADSVGVDSVLLTVTEAVAGEDVPPMLSVTVTLTFGLIGDPEFEPVRVQVALFGQLLVVNPGDWTVQVYVGYESEPPDGLAVNVTVWPESIAVADCESVTVGGA